MQYPDTINGAALAEFETPFADEGFVTTENRNEELEQFNTEDVGEFESPFAGTFEAPEGKAGVSAAGEEYVQLLAELHDSEFEDTLYELADEAEESWLRKISNEAAMEENFVPFAMQQGNEYFAPLITETESMIDRVADHFSRETFPNQSETEFERFFSEFEFPVNNFSPAQENFFGSIFKKVKSVVKKGIDLAKKGISVVGKFLPINIILNKLKGLIRPLLQKVLRFAIGKLPETLQPYASTLAKKFLNLETEDSELESQEMPAAPGLSELEFEFDNQVASVAFAESEFEADTLKMEYENTASGNYSAEGESGVNMPSLEVARQNFIDELKNLKEGDSPAPAIERFLPVAIMALRPAIKMALSIIGRQKVINFLAGLLAKLVGRYVPQNVARPLAASIIDVGLSAIGFETYEQNKPDLTYETIANTIQETVQNLEVLNEHEFEDRETLAASLLEAFENAAANNFPSDLIREEARLTSRRGMWIMKPRDARHLYKKYSHVFDATITPAIAKRLSSMNGSPLSSFLRDKLGMAVNKNVKARVHLFEAIKGTRLSQVARHERAIGSGNTQGRYSNLFHPLTMEAASLLCHEPGLGKRVSKKYLGRKHRLALGQRFFYLEIPGAHLQMAQKTVRNKTISETAAASDVQAVLNFIRSEITFRYFFSEQEAKSIVEKINRNDYTGTALTIKQSLKNVLNSLLEKNISNRVKIVHEAIPELYLEAEESEFEENFSFSGAIKTVANAVAINPAKAILLKLVSTVVNRFAENAYEAISTFFKTRAKEFRQAQAEVQDGVTLELKWKNVPGMSALRTVISAVKGNLSLGNLSDLKMPALTTPELKISAGKNFE